MNIFPKIIYQTKSKYSREIKVIEQFGKWKLEVNDIVQSGGIVKEIWEMAVKNKQISNVLILGLGGGTVARMISQRWSETRIVGIEIDPVIIEVGRRYFSLDKIKNLKIINADAIKWVDDKYHHRGFDLIIVDLYIGDKFPKEAESRQFLLNLKKLLIKNGLIIFNRLYYGRHKKTTHIFLDKLKKLGYDVFTRPAPGRFFHSNLLIYAN